MTLEHPTKIKTVMINFQTKLSGLNIYNKFKISFSIPVHKSSY